MTTRLAASPSVAVSRLAMGCEPLGGTDWGAVDLAEAAATVRQAWDGGITVFDTADVYGLGESEKRLAKALGRERHKAILISKFGVAWQSAADGRAATHRDASPAHLVQALEASLRRLDVEQIAVYLVHWPDTHTPVHETIGELETQRARGKIGAFGVSNFAGDHLKEATRLGASVVELPLNLIDQRCLPDLQDCAQRGIRTLAYAPYAQGFLSGNYSAETRFGINDRRHRLKQFSPAGWRQHARLLEALRAIAKSREVTTSTVALAWVLSHWCVGSAVVGLKSRSQLAEAQEALRFQLLSAELEMLAASVNSDASC